MISFEIAAYSLCLVPRTLGERPPPVSQSRYLTNEVVEQATRVVHTNKLNDYKSRKFLLTTASMAVFVVLLLINKLSGDQFVDGYIWLIGLHFIQKGFNIYTGGSFNV